MYEFLKNQWEGKKVCFLGDSITDGVGVQKGERYLDLLDDMIGIKSVGYGVNGASFIGLLSQIDRSSISRRALLRVSMPWSVRIFCRAMSSSAFVKSAPPRHGSPSVATTR